jgi:MFS superfamily sulfate permease-like transporter
MDIVGRVKGILLTPEAEWPVIEHEPGTPAYLFPHYVVYLAAIPPVAGFIGSSIIGVTGPTGTFRVQLFAGLLGAVIAYVLSFAVVYAVAIIIDQLAPRFGGQKDFSAALKTTVYSLTPYWIAGVFQLVAGLRFVGYVVAFFGIYLLWIGLPRLMKAPPDKALAYVAIAAACAVVAMAAITLIEDAFLT